MRLVGRRAARPFASLIREMDLRVGQAGLQVGTAWGLQHLVGSLLVAGQEHIPPNGPVLIVANHPGLSDTVAMMAAIPRPDLLILAAETDFLRSLPAIAHHLKFLPDDAAGRLGASRAVVRHLRDGGAVLAFPRGQIEPDPDLLAGAAASIEQWSRSIGLFVRLAPATRVVPAIVRGVLSPLALANPLTRLRRSAPDRERLAAGLQVAFGAYQGVTVRVVFGPALRGTDLLAPGRELGLIANQIIHGARRLLDNPPVRWERLIGADTAAATHRERRSALLPASLSPAEYGDGS